MKPVYETVQDGIRRLIRESYESNRRLSYIELTVDEANELGGSYRRFLAFDSPTYYKRFTPRDGGAFVGYFLGVELRVAKS